MKSIVLTLISILISSCTHSIHIAHVSDFSPTYKSYQAGELVKSRAEQFVILGFIFDTHYVDQAYRQLQTKCPNGDIQGIVTQSITDHGFFSWTNRIEMQGLCVQKSAEVSQNTNR